MSTAPADVRLDGDSLVSGDVHGSFQRTVGLRKQGPFTRRGAGQFPLRWIADNPRTAPASWLAKGGVSLPVYQREAMWLSIDADAPSALKSDVGNP